MKATCGAVSQRRVVARMRLSSFEIRCTAAVVARRMAHKYVDGYYSRLAAHRKRSENFRATYT